MQQHKKGGKLAKSTIAFTSGQTPAVTQDGVLTSESKNSDSVSEALTTSNENFAKSGLRRRAPVGSGRMVERLGSYIVERKIGASKAAELYRCAHALTHEPALVKVFRSQDDSASLETYTAELGQFSTDGAGVSILSRGLCPVGPYYIVAYSEELLAFLKNTL